MSTASSYRYYFFSIFTLSSPAQWERGKTKKKCGANDTENKIFKIIDSSQFAPSRWRTARHLILEFDFILRISLQWLYQCSSRSECASRWVCVCVFLMLLITSYFMYYSVDFCCLFSHQRHNVRRTVSQSQSVYNDSEVESKKLVMKK